MTHAFVFPGQGSQSIGMGHEVYQSFAEARDVFNEVDEALGQKLSALMFEGDLEELTLTHNAQPALMATSIAVLKVLEKQGGKSLADFASHVAGHSLGEYTALCAAGAISIADTAKLLRIRGNAMQDAVPQGKGGMAALIGLDLDVAEDVAQKAVAAAGSGEVLQVANDNSPGQVVLSGSMAAIAAGEAFAKEAGAKRYLPLNVSAPFHSVLMEPAAKVMAEALAEAAISSPSAPLIANVTADVVTDPDMIRSYLVQQMTGRVRWRESVGKLADLGVSKTVEVGAGKVLSGLTKRINKGLEATSIGTPEQIETFLE